MLKSVIGAFLGVALFYGVLCLVSDDPAQRKAELAPRYLPDDIGVKTVLWLEPNADGVLTLQWEKHADAGYGMAHVPSEFGQMIIPVSVD